MNTEKRKYFDQIKFLYANAYDNEKRKKDKLVHLWGYYVTRPISMIIAPFFIKLGVRANHATFLSLFVGLISLFFGTLGHLLFSAILYNIFLVFDALDGNLARYLGPTGPTKKGELMDAIVGDLLNFSFLPCLSIGLTYSQLNEFCLIKSILELLLPFAFISSLLLVISILIAQRVKIILNNPIKLVNQKNSRFIYLLEIIFRNSFGMAFIGPFSIVFIAFKALDIFVLYNLFISVVVLLYTIYSAIQSATNPK